MSVYTKLLAVQSELKAPKSQFNSFGKYKYRSCEDILEALKPVCAKHNAITFITDTISVVGNRYYVTATATFVDVETGEKVEVSAHAREEESKKGMDSSQVTGASSSYARKYALNGLFCIDDTKDSDYTNGIQQNQQPQQPPQQQQKRQLTPRETLIVRLKQKGIDAKAFANEHQISQSTTDEEYARLLALVGD